MFAQIFSLMHAHAALLLIVGVAAALAPWALAPLVAAALPLALSNHTPEVVLCSVAGSALTSVALLAIAAGGIGIAALALAARTGRSIAHDE